ncbi:hypothetical protein [Verticiella alkaliphila]|uniref:hypothetical protein n=1 Tax=Verticiella alkaliphila TaxID=2779529 RepID=UPI0035303227
MISDTPRVPGPAALAVPVVLLVLLALVPVYASWAGEPFFVSSSPASSSTPSPPRP